jgi:hypothetical protein
MVLIMTELNSEPATIVEEGPPIEPSRRKTYKREVGVIMLSGLSYCVFQGNTEMVELLIWPIMTFNAGAFGMDAIAQHLRR